MNGKYNYYFKITTIQGHPILYYLTYISHALYIHKSYSLTRRIYSLSMFDNSYFVNRYKNCFLSFLFFFVSIWKIRWYWSWIIIIVLRRVLNCYWNTNYSYFFLAMEWVNTKFSFLNWSINVCTYYKHVPTNC